VRPSSIETTHRHFEDQVILSCAGQHLRDARNVRSIGEHRDPAHTACSSAIVPAILASVILSTFPVLALYVLGRCQLVSGLTAGFGR
jgi:hypothetical protein